MSQDLELAIQAAKQAGAVVKEMYGKTKKATSKGRLNDFVTATDIEAEKIIAEQLKQTGYSILGEETGTTDNQTRKKWIIDPIDGTINFIRGIPFFALSIALIEDVKDVIIGVVYDPIADECYWAEKNDGAYLNGEKIHVSKLGNFDGAIVLIEHNRSEQGKKDYLNASKKLILNKGAVVLRQGSSALMLCYIAKGSSDAFLSSGDEIYDIAGGLIIAKEAGAVISDWNGKKWENSDSYILASNPNIQNKVLERIAGIQK